MKHRPRLPLLLIFIVSLTMPQTTSPANAAETNASERQPVLEVVQKFFDTMAAKDVAGAKATLLPDGQYYAVRNDPGTPVMQRRTHEEYLTRMAAGKDRPLERMWDATVMIHDRIALVWTPYDFHRNGKFTHSGVDIFTLIKTENGWRIAGLVFTAEPNAPSQHPAGPPPATAEN